MGPNEASLLALRNFENIRQLEGLNSCDLVGWTSVCDARALLERLVRRANEDGMAGIPTPTSEAAVACRKSSGQLDQCAGEHEYIVRYDANAAREQGHRAHEAVILRKRWDQRKRESKRHKLDGLGCKLTPQAGGYHLAKSQGSGDLITLLELNGR